MSQGDKEIVFIVMSVGVGLVFALWRADLMGGAFVICVFMILGFLRWA